MMVERDRVHQSRRKIPRVCQLSADLGMGHSDHRVFGLMHRGPLPPRQIKDLHEFFLKILGKDELSYVVQNARRERLSIRSVLQLLCQDSSGHRTGYTVFPKALMIEHRILDIVGELSYERQTQAQVFDRLESQNDDGQIDGADLPLKPIERGIDQSQDLRS